MNRVGERGSGVKWVCNEWLDSVWFHGMYERGVAMLEVDGEDVWKERLLL